MLAGDEKKRRDERRRLSRDAARSECAALERAGKNRCASRIGCRSGGNHGAARPERNRCLAENRPQSNKWKLAVSCDPITSAGARASRCRDDAAPRRGRVKLETDSPQTLPPALIARCYGYLCACRRRGIDTAPTLCVSFGARGRGRCPANARADT